MNKRENKLYNIRKPIVNFNRYKQVVDQAKEEQKPKTPTKQEANVEMVQTNTKLNPHDKPEKVDKNEASVKKDQKGRPKVDKNTVEKKEEKVKLTKEELDSKLREKAYKPSCELK